MSTSHTTEHEKEFIDGLGSFCLVKYNRAELLGGYIKAAMQRKDWGDVNATEVILYAHQKLDELTEI